MGLCTRLNNNSKNKIGLKYKLLNPIVSAVRFISDGNFHRDEFQRYDKRCGAMIGKLNDDAVVDSLFLKAVKIVDGVAGSWDRTSSKTNRSMRRYFS